MAIASSKKILVAPLDWGLGHTTRCIPIIRHLQTTGNQVVVAGNKAQLQYMQNSLGTLDTIFLEGYNVHYGSSGLGTAWSVAAQIPHILGQIKKENKRLKELQQQWHFDGIISDNRYGLHLPGVPSVILTHQLQIQTGLGPLSNAVVRNMHYRFLHRFDECWIVDVPRQPNLSGELAQPPVLPQNGKYIGLLSQMDAHRQPVQNEHLLIILSGPEPQRSILAKNLWQQALKYKGRLVFVEGSDEAAHPGSIPGHINYYRRIAGEALQPLLVNASMVVCRSGYSSLMDLALLNKKAILIPTPGQTEQEYLAKYLHQQQAFLSVRQKDFDLEKALSLAAAFPFKSLGLQNDFDVHKKVLDNWLTRY